MPGVITTASVKDLQKCVCRSGGVGLEHAFEDAMTCRCSQNGLIAFRQPTCGRRGSPCRRKLPRSCHDLTRR